MNDIFVDIIFVIAILLVAVKIYQTVSMLNRRTHQDPKLNPYQKEAEEKSKSEEE